MSGTPDPSEVFDRAVEEGKRRLGQSLLELVATSFIAGFTIVFGIAALGIVDAAVEPQFGRLAHVAGALTFGTGFVFLIAGRAELFTENFFDPIAAVIDSESYDSRDLLRLWGITFVLNIVGGAVFVFVLSVDGAFPPGTVDALRGFALETVHRRTTAEFAKAVTGGALVMLLSYTLSAVEGAGGRLFIAYIVGFLLVLGPFNHVIVTTIHVLFGVAFTDEIGLRALMITSGTIAVGNVVGGIGLVTVSHVAQVEGAKRSAE